MPVLIVTVIALSTLAVGAVYPWAYYPLFAFAALTGVAGLRRGGVPSELRGLALALLLLWVAIAVQLVPLPVAVVEAFSPATIALVRSYNLAFPTLEWLPLSVDPASTRTAVIAAGALALYLLGLPALLVERLRTVPTTLAVFAAPFALFSIYAREYQNGLIYWVWKPLEGGGANQFGPFVNRNHFGGWMLMTVCLLVGLLFGLLERATADSRRRRSGLLAWVASPAATRVVLTASVLIVGVVSLFWTLSRSSIMAFGVASLVFGWLLVKRRRPNAAPRRVGLAAVATLLLTGIVWRGPLQLLAWFNAPDHLFSRIDAWRDGWDVVRAFPLFGTGLNTFATAMLFYQRRNPTEFMSRAHNDYVQVLAEGGILVAVPAAAAIVLLARAIRRNLRAAHGEARGYWIRTGAAVGLLAVAVQELVEFSLQIPANALLFCTLAAVALTPPSAPRPGARDTINTG